MTTRLFNTIAKTVAKVVPAAGAAYDLLLDQDVSGTARVDGDFPTGSVSIDLSDIPADLGSTIMPGDALRIGADPTSYTVTNTTTISSGRAVGVSISPALSNSPTNGGSLDITREASHRCKGLVTAFSAFSIAQGMVRATDRKVLILAATLPTGVKPRSGDRITTPDGIVTIVAGDTPGRAAVNTDPAGATHDCRCA